MSCFISEHTCSAHTDHIPHTHHTCTHPSTMCTTRTTSVPHMPHMHVHTYITNMLYTYKTHVLHKHTSHTHPYTSLRSYLTNSTHTDINCTYTPCVTHLHTQTHTYTCILVNPILELVAADLGGESESWPGTTSFLLEVPAACLNLDHAPLPPLLACMQGLGQLWSPELGGRNLPAVSGCSVPLSRVPAGLGHKQVQALRPRYRMCVTPVLAWQGLELITCH